MALKILIVDDDDNHRFILRSILETLGYAVTEAGSTKAGKEAIIADEPDCIILDHRMIGDNGLVMLHEMSKELPLHPPVIFVSSVLDEGLKRNALELGAFAYLDKAAVTPESLHRSILGALEFSKLPYLTASLK